ncbi:unnamed protein product [Arabis nemorensis]|uniref:DUF4283 domain-containing protein n=1 Tax=Arabis nemorensis TaxID=586526 RepID=A0A565CL60_9BRAS|nr:unnamed protein product [Arabis nemorensis]
MGLNKQSNISPSKSKSKSKKQHKKGLFSPPAKDGLSGASLAVSSPPPPETVTRTTEASSKGAPGSGPAIDGTVAPEVAIRVTQEQSMNFPVAEEVTSRSGSGFQKPQNLIPKQTQKLPTETPKLVAASNKAPTQEAQTSPNVAVTKPSLISSSQAPLTWCQRFKTGSSTLSKCGTPIKLDNGELCVTIPNKVIEESKPLWKDFVIGQFYRKTPSFGKIKAVIDMVKQVGPVLREKGLRNKTVGPVSNTQQVGGSKTWIPRGKESVGNNLIIAASPVKADIKRNPPEQHDMDLLPEVDEKGEEEEEEEGEFIEVISKRNKKSKHLRSSQGKALKKVEGRALNPIAEKLDRMLGNDQWLLKFPDSSFSFEELLFSDNAACCFRIPDLAPKPKRPFKFNLHLIHHPEFLSIVDEAWRGFRVVGSSMQQKRTSEALESLKLSQQELLSSPSTIAAESKLFALNKWKQLAKAEEYA